MSDLLILLVFVILLIILVERLESYFTLSMVGYVAITIMYFEIQMLSNGVFDTLMGGAITAYFTPGVTTMIMLMAVFVAISPFLKIVLLKLEGDEK